MMQHLISYSILLLIFFPLRILFKNLKSKFYKDHQKLAGREFVPLIGGMILFCYYTYKVSFFDYDFFLFSFLILLLGIFSDNNILQSPRLRLILQTLVLLFFMYLSDLQVSDLRSEFLNNFISNYYIGLFFTTFCLLTLINGSNFIDGLDGLNLGYFFLIITIIFYLNNSQLIKANEQQIISIFHVVSFLLILNIFNYLYLGDSGSYLIGFIFGIFLIDLSNNNYSLSPYFVTLLLWYPAFENLFSIIRKRIIKDDPFKPDNNHFHQLLFNYLKKNNNNFIKKFSNVLSSILIIFYNLIIFFIGLNFTNHTKILLLLISINIFVYLVLYFILKKKISA
jgi:UDP-N-acetylmuramyl pentapeptide phosphotransferase/UDP-N-acetylglucosamine-1-phosphate transferase